MLSERICINENLILNLGFKLDFTRADFICFTKNNLILYLYSNHIDIVVEYCYGCTTFQLNKLKEFLRYIKSNEHYI